MPTTTFFNLPPPKRDRLIRAAMAEFSRKSFGDASINHIIQDAGISRGSFYQYFADKGDLFHFVLAYFGQQLEKTILSSLDACQGNLLSAPLAFFDQVQDFMRENHCEFRVLLNILRQNVSMDAGRLWDLSSATKAVLERADLSRLNIQGPEEQFALLQLLFTSAAQELMAASCGKSTLEECRNRLGCKIEIIRRGAAIK